MRLFFQRKRYKLLPNHTEPTHSTLSPLPQSDHLVPTAAVNLDDPTKNLLTTLLTQLEDTLNETQQHIKKQEDIFLGRHNEEKFTPNTYIDLRILRNKGIRLLELKKTVQTYIYRINTTHPPSLHETNTLNRTYTTILDGNPTSTQEAKEYQP